MFFLPTYKKNNNKSPQETAEVWKTYTSNQANCLYKLNIIKKKDTESRDYNPPLLEKLLDWDPGYITFVWIR